MKIHPLPKYEDVISKKSDSNAPVVRKSHTGMYLGLLVGLFLAGGFFWGDRYNLFHGETGLTGSMQQTFTASNGKKQTIILHEGASSIKLEPASPKGNSTQASSTSDPGIVVIPSSSSSNTSNK